MFSEEPGTILTGIFAAAKIPQTSVRAAIWSFDREE